MVYDHMIHFGDRKLVRTYIGTVDNVLSHFDEKINGLGLLGMFDEESWPFIDWVEEWFISGRASLRWACLKRISGAGCRDCQ